MSSSLPLLSAHPARNALTGTVKASLNTKTTSIPKKQADGFYYWRWNEKLPRDLVPRSKDLDQDFGEASTESGAEVVLHLNQEQHKSLYMDSWSASGRYYCAVLQKSGSDWQTLRTLATHTMKYIDDDLGFSKITFGACWIGDQGFLYKRYVGAFVDGPVPDDILVWSGTGPPAKSCIMGRPRVVSTNAGSEETRKWLTLDIYLSTNPESEVIMVKLPSEPNTRIGQEIKRLFAEETRWLWKGFTGQTLYIGPSSDGRHFFRSTADDHSSGRIIYTINSDWDDTDPSSTLPFHEVRPTHPNEWPINHAQLIANDVLVVVYLHDACAAVIVYDATTGEEIGVIDATGTEGDVSASQFDIRVPPNEIEAETSQPAVIPKHASVSELSGRPDSYELFMTVETFISRPYILRAKVLKNSCARRIKLELLVQSSPADDGTNIPLFPCHRTDLDLTRPQPALLHAYGGFGIPIRPHFDAFFFAFMRNLSGVLAVAGIRDGGEYGKSWHDAAIGTRKTVAWDDFAAAARYLHYEAISTPAQTAIYGFSNGGLLVSASIVRSPGLFSVALPDVALTDLVRFHRFYGDPTSTDNLPTLRRISPLHNVEDVSKYPSVLVTTAENDNRVVPGHSLKFLAELQSKAPPDSSVFLGRIYSDTGHEPGTKSIDQKVQEAVDRPIFILSYMQNTR